MISTDDEGQAAWVEKVELALREALAGGDPAPVAEEACPPALLSLVQTANELLRCIREIREWLATLAGGELSAPLPSLSGNKLALPFHEMNASLTTLTRKAQQVACGDFSQRVDRLGEFSAAFNSMVELLAEREQALRDEIARRHEAEDELQHERDLLVSGPLVTLRWDIDDAGTVQYVSPNITAAFGYGADEFLSGRRLYGEIIHPDDLGWVTDDGNTKARAGLEGWTQEYRLIDARGAEHWVRDFTHAVRDDEGAVTSYEGFIIDITAEKTAEASLRAREAQLRVLSLSDDLTGISNRRGLYALGEQLYRTARRHGSALCVLVIDIDGLRDINDRLGHARGDEALRDLAGMLRAAAHESDVVARLGNDDFVVVVEDDETAAAGLLARVRRRLAALAARGERQSELSISAGIAGWRPGDRTTTLEELVETAAARQRDDTHTQR